MMTNDAELSQSMEQLDLMSRALAALRRDVFPVTPVNSPCSRKAPRKKSNACKTPSTSTLAKMNWRNPLRDTSQPKRLSCFGAVTNMKHWGLKAASPHVATSAQTT